MLNALILSMAMFSPLPAQERPPMESPTVIEALDRAIVIVGDTVAPNTIPANATTEDKPASIDVSPEAQKHLDAVAKYKLSDMSEPVPVATHKVYLEMHNLVLQKVDVILDASVAYSPSTGQIDVLGGGTEILSHETIFNPYSLLWVIAAAILILPPLLNTTYRNGSKLVLLWEVSMVATVLAAVTGFVTWWFADRGVSDRYMIASVFNSLAIMSGSVAYQAAKQNKPVSWHAVVYGPCMTASAAAFMFPW